MLNRVFDVEPTKLRTTTLPRADFRVMESLTAIGNGHMGMRGNFEEGYSGDHHLGTYLAGVWYPDRTRVGWWKNGYPEYFGKAINALNFAAIEVFINGHRIDLGEMQPSAFELELDLRNGLLTRQFEVGVPGASARIKFERFLSIVDVELCWQRVTVECLVGEADLELRPRIDRDVHNQDSNYGEQFWAEEDRRIGESVLLSTRTKENPFGVERFTVTAASTVNVDAIGFETETGVGLQIVRKLAPGQQLSVERVTAVVTSRDHKSADHRCVVDELLRTAQEHGFERDFIRHNEAWERRWETAAVTISGDDEAQQGIQFNLFQLFATYYGHDYRLNIGPKGFTGEKYGGATYWDTEAYLLPLYLAVSDPEVPKALLRYRHDQLPQARANAEQLGLAGALYPMVTFNGVECHNEWEITFEEIHRNGAIAFAIFNYARFTGDREYLEGDGAEVLVELSRFWASRAHYSSQAQAWMIHGVTGPNEYENNANNNWYTNYLAAWTLRFTAQLLDSLEGQGINREVELQERRKWLEIAQGMYSPYDSERGVFVQHDTFLDKDLRSVDTLRTEERPLNQHWSWDRILRSCFIKQADVLQGMYLFEDDFSTEELRRNFEFYEPMTVHESSLSASIHSVVASKIGAHDKAMELYRRTARLDLDNYNADTEDGLHITSMSGAWLAIVQGFAGLRVRSDRLSLDPHCPQNWDSYSFCMNFRGRSLQFAISGSGVAVELRSGEPMTLLVSRQEYRLTTQLEVLTGDDN